MYVYMHMNVCLHVCITTDRENTEWSNISMKVSVEFGIMVDIVYNEAYQVLAVLQVDIKQNVCKRLGKVVPVVKFV